MIGERQGVIGINFDVASIRADGKDNLNTPLDLIVDHMVYVVDKIGIDHVAFGSDYDGCFIPTALKDVANLQLLINTLRNRGFHVNEIEKIAYKNWIRVIDAIL